MIKLPKDEESWILSRPKTLVTERKNFRFTRKLPMELFCTVRVGKLSPIINKEVLTGESECSSKLAPLANKILFRRWITPVYDFSIKGDTGAKNRLSQILIQNSSTTKNIREILFIPDDNMIIYFGLRQKKICCSTILQHFWEFQQNYDFR